MKKIRQLIIAVMIAFYLAVNSCEGSFYSTYTIAYHTIVLDDYNPDILYDSGKRVRTAVSIPGEFVKYPASFYPGINMISINQYRFSLN